MCKPGSASGSGATSSGLGLAVAVVAVAGVVSMATTVIGTIITAALITVFSLAAAGIVALVVILRRTRSVVTWPMRATLPPAAGRRTAPRRVRTAPSLPAQAQARPVAAAMARPAVPARRPLAIEAPAPVAVRIGVPTRPGDPAVVVWPPAPGSGQMHGAPAPQEIRPDDAYPDWAGLAAASGLTATR